MAGPSHAAVESLIVGTSPPKDFRAEHQVFPSQISDDLTQHFFRFSTGIGFGAINEVDSVIQGRMNGFGRLVVYAATIGDPRAQ